MVVISQSDEETQDKQASHRAQETHRKPASHPSQENQSTEASHMNTDLIAIASIFLYPLLTGVVVAAGVVRMLDALGLIQDE